MPASGGNTGMTCLAWVGWHRQVVSKSYRNERAVQYVEHNTRVDAPAFFGQADTTLTVPRLSANGRTPFKTCPYCTDPDCDNPLFCAAYEPPPLDTVPLGDFVEVPTGSLQDRCGNALFSDQMLLHLEINGVTTSIVLHPSERIFLGRQREHRARGRAIDLTPYDARQHGVSRVHAAIIQRGRTLTVTDLHSKNGTYLNDQRLVPNQSRILRDGDTILLGSLTARVRFE